MISGRLRGNRFVALDSAGRLVGKFNSLAALTRR
jgi:hypothetical protein